MKKLYIVGLMALGFASCKPSIDPVKPEKGQADFSRYVAIGNSLTAGYADGSLYRSGQENSYPAMLAKQFALVGGGAFLQPLLPGQYGYPGPKFQLLVRKGLCDAEASLGVVPFQGALDTAGSSLSVAYLGPFNNMGVPGIRCVDYLMPGYGMFNPYAHRMFLNPSGARPLDEAVRLNPSFFTLWLGSNDVLLYATAGGEGGSPAQGQVVSDLAAFTYSYDSVVKTLTRFGAKGVLLNIPDITAIPFFTTVPAKGLTLTPKQANDLNDAYNGTSIRFNNEGGSSYFIIEDTSVALRFRQVRDGEFMLLSLPMDSVKCKGWGTTKPVPARYVLTANEVSKVKTASANFNQYIAQVANAYGLPMVDMNAYLGTVSSGIKFNGASYNATFVSGGAFSLDGIHLTPRGYALVANQIIMAINNSYGATLPWVDVNAYNGLKLP